MSSIEELKSELASIDSQLKDLESRKANLNSEIQKEEKRLAEAVLAKLVEELKAYNIAPAEVAKALGLSVVPSVQKKERAPRGSAVPKAKGVPKYRSSIDPSLTWTGKGRKPAWIETYLNNGGNLEDWRIKVE